MYALLVAAAAMWTTLAASFSPAVTVLWGIGRHLRLYFDVSSDDQDLSVIAKHPAVFVTVCVFKPKGYNQGCRSRPFWLEPEPFIWSGSCSYSTPTPLL